MLESVWLIITSSSEITLGQRQCWQVLLIQCVNSQLRFVLTSFFLFDIEQSIFASYLISKFFIFDLPKL